MLTVFSRCFSMLVREKIVYASRGVSGTLNKRMCGKIVNAHVFKMAGKITHFFSSKSGKESQDKEPSNGIQPPAKKVCSNSTASKVYDGTLRVRKFLPKWENDFPWIQFTEGKMFCKYCLEVSEHADKNSSFYKGSDKFRIGVIRAHNKSKQHFRCADVYRARRNPQNPIQQGLRNMECAVQEKLIKLFNTAYFVAKEEMPFSSFKGLCGLQIKNDVELGKTYLNDHACKNFIESSAEILKADLSGKLNNASPRFFSAMADGSTDSGVVEQELLFVRFLDNGLPVNRFLTVQSVKHADADGILHAIGNGFNYASVVNWKDGLVGFGSDGASVMMGRQNGVLKKIKDDVPHLIEMHCVAHRLELAILDAFKGESILTELKDLLQGIYKHYHYSPKALRELNELAQVLELSVLKPVSVLDTRWTPHLHRALKVFLENFTVIYTHFENTAARGDGASAAMQGRARKTTKQMSDFKQVLFMHFMLDTLDVVSRLSLVMQKDAVTLAEVKDSIERTSLSIQAMVARPGAKLSQFLEVVANGNQFKGVELNRQDGDIATFNLIKQRVIGSMVAYLNSRFANVSTNDVIAAFDIFNTSLWPDSDDELALYGEQELNTLVGHFKLLLERNDFDSELVNQEWQELKVCIKRNHSQLKMLPMWQRIFAEYTERFPNILMLVEIMLVLPLATACCERGFSTLKRIKSDWRSRLGTETLDHLMRISIDGPDLESYNAARALQHWWDKGERQRRPEFQLQRK